ncbi:TetR/AcrR family transcriptional regulator C-terminal domain-containing protein [Roseixanthobacter glucoisosaccharinicivorans]|uniref:TetR/AcrR family transcriptional regulator C-terminal domain-containing protein n=1 Tax=Roseixanthobacter glucoisosaccharinicivorans TaxID=3119923 RepID=UPI0037285E0A
MEDRTIKDHAVANGPGWGSSKDEIIVLVARALAIPNSSGQGISSILARIGVAEEEVRSAFGDKESLIVAIAQREAWLISEPLVTWRGGTAEGFARALMKFGYIAAGEYSRRLIGFVRMMAIEGARYPSLERKVHDVGPAFVTLKLREFLSTGNRCGVFAIPDPQLAAEQLMGLLREPLYGALMSSPTHDARTRELRALESVTRFFNGSILDGTRTSRRPWGPSRPH